EGNSGVDYKIAVSPAQLPRTFFNSRQPLSIRVVPPAIDHASYADETDSRRNDTIEIVSNNLEHRRTYIADYCAPTEHTVSRLNRVLLISPAQTRSPDAAPEPR